MTAYETAAVALLGAWVAFHVLTHAIANKGVTGDLRACFEEVWGS